PFFDRECKSLKRLYQRVRSSDPEMARVLRRKYAHVVRRKCRVYRQQQTHILLREIRRKPQDFWKKLNGRPEPLPQPLQRQGQWRQYMSDLCAPATAAVPQPVVAAPAAACQAAEPLNQPITSAEVESALPLLNNNRSGAGQGWPAELLRYAYREVQDEDGKTLKFHVLARPLAAILDAAFQRGILPDDDKSSRSSLVTPVFKKGDKCDPANYRPIAVGEPLCRLYAAILNRRIVSWAEEAGLRAPCQAGFRPRMSTEHQLFALRHFIDRARFQKQPLFAAFVDLRKAYDSVQHPLLWASLQRKGVHGKMLAAIQSLYSGGAMSMKICGRAGATGTAQVGVRQGCPLSPTLFGLFFDDLYSQLQSDCPSAGVECRGTRIPSLFYADDVALLWASAQGLQQMLDSMQ
ncbi:reverse transcriptase family protein, partial [bacterium]